MTEEIGKYNVSQVQDGHLLVQSESINDKIVSTPKTEPMIINGAWYLNSLPNHVVAELIDGSLAKFFLTPFRGIKEIDLTPYKGDHPRKSKGQPLPDYLYKFYGLARNEESLSEVVRVRVSPSEKVKLESASSNHKKSVSEFLREYIRGL